ncbi:MAG TPA: prolipoprotein diacylglyceryl transferase [bacterium]|nr:prolipoprotein diacylglyceryl transferase [bacterium]HPP29717.1 prolipoprotein diacylglyceryl transferase [bacterium]
MHPEFLRIGSFVIYWYGVFVAAGVLVGSIIFQKTAYKQGYSPQLISNLLFWVVVWGLLGGRFLHILVHISYYYRNPFDIIRIRNGGLAVEGAVITAFIFLIIYSRIKKFNLKEMLDIVALSTPLGQAIGRIGCFLNGCCYGKPTEILTGVKFPFSAERVHPTQLYYSALYILLFFFLNALYRKRLKQGMVFSCYMLGFSLIRYLVDMLRGDLSPTFTGLYPTQVMAIVLFIIGVWYLFSILFEKEV